ncbi:hypothetical protein DFP72DRAFT_1075730 [Ephemerocybe angulata]|uniref:Uncharacterized protein n=1 Tax=Ephemerocybe angulata TaxID=980116 RepID=A0A8H6HIP8_9AGAR|nr:hypothetical protein DFP72DRAFT_1075730 [Tulosesus angulatus]
MPAGRPRLYSTPEEKKAANCAKSKRSYELNKNRISKKRKLKRQSKADSPEAGGSVTTSSQTKSKRSLASSAPLQVAKQKTLRTDLEILLDRLPGLEERFRRALGHDSIYDYLSDICKVFAKHEATDDLDRANKHIERELVRMNAIQAIISNCVSLALNLDPFGGAWRKWEPLRKKVDTVLKELNELSADAIMGPGQLVIDYHRKALKFQMGVPAPSVEPHAPTQDAGLVVEQVEPQGTAMEVDPPASPLDDVGGRNTSAPRAVVTDSPLFIPQTTTSKSGSSDATEPTASHVSRTPDWSLFPFGINRPLPHWPSRSTISPPPAPSISAAAALIEKANETTGRLRALTQPFERSNHGIAPMSTSASTRAAPSTNPPPSKPIETAGGTRLSKRSKRTCAIAMKTPKRSDSQEEEDTPEKDDSSDYYVSDIDEPTPGQPRAPLVEESGEEVDDDDAPLPPRPSSFFTEKIGPHSGRIPKIRVWTMIAMRVPGIPGSGLNCKMTCIRLIMAPDGYKENFRHHWVLRYALFWNPRLERWTFLPAGWVPDWPPHMRYPPSEQSLSEYWLATQHKVSELRLEELRREELRRASSITPPPPVSPSAIRMALHEMELRNPSLLRKPGTLDWTWLSSPTPSRSPTPQLSQPRRPPPAAPAPSPARRSPSVGPSRRLARSSRLPARYNDFEADPKSDLANTKILNKEVSESDATDTRDPDFSGNQDSSSSSDEEGVEVVSDDGIEKVVSKKKKKKSSQQRRRQRQRQRSRTPDEPPAEDDAPAEESTPRPPCPPRRPASNPSPEDDDEDGPRRDKGKGRAVDAGSSNSSSSSSDEEDTGPRPDKGKGRAPRSPTPKPKSRQPRDLTESELAELVAIHQRIEQLSDDTGHTTKAILGFAGFERIGLSRDANTFNIFESWLSHQPDTPPMPRDEFVQYARALYHEYPREDLPELAEQWQLETIQIQEQEGRPAPTSRGVVREITQAGKQLDGLCRKIKLTTDLDLVCLLTSQDPVARQLSAVYSSSDSLRAVVDQEEVLVRDLIERFVTAMQSLDMGIIGAEGLSLRNILGIGNAQSGSGSGSTSSTPNTQPSQPVPRPSQPAPGPSQPVPGPSTPRNEDAAPPPPYSSQGRGEAAVRRARTAPAPRPTNANPRNAVDLRTLGKSFPDGSFWVRKHGESNKDYHRRIVRFMFQVKFADLVDEPNFTNFWKKILSLLVKYKVVLRDWPAHLPAPGTANFDIGRLDLTFTSELCNAWRQYSTELTVPPWFDFWGPDFSDITRDDLAFMDIPLVMGLTDFGEEVVLVEVRDCPPMVEALATRAREYVEEAQRDRGSRSLAEAPPVAPAPVPSTSRGQAQRQEPARSTLRDPVPPREAGSGDRPEPRNRVMSPPRFVQGSSGAGRSNGTDGSAARDLSIALERLREPAPSRPPRVVAPAPARENGAPREPTRVPAADNIIPPRRERGRSRSPSQSPERAPVSTHNPNPRRHRYRSRSRSRSDSRARYRHRHARSVSSESRRSIRSRSYHGRRRGRSPLDVDSDSDSPARHRHTRRRHR